MTYWVLVWNGLTVDGLDVLVVEVVMDVFVVEVVVILDKVSFISSFDDILSFFAGGGCVKSDDIDCSAN